MADRDAPDAGLLIDGARVPAAAGERAPVRNPATGVEMPFGGVKRSGVRRELGPSALEHYSEQKSVFIAED